MPDQDQALYGDDDNTIEIAGKKFPKWMIYVAGGILVIGVIYLVSKGRSETSGAVSGDGLLAEEYNQRLKEFYEQQTAPPSSSGEFPGTTTTPPPTENVVVNPPTVQETFLESVPTEGFAFFPGAAPANQSVQPASVNVVDTAKPSVEFSKHVPTSEQVISTVKSAQLKKSVKTGTFNWNQSLTVKTPEQIAAARGKTKSNTTPVPPPTAQSQVSSPSLSSSTVLEAIKSASGRKTSAPATTSKPKSAPRSTTKSTTSSAAKSTRTIVPPAKPKTTASTKPTMPSRKR